MNQWVPPTRVTHWLSGQDTAWPSKDATERYPGVHCSPESTTVTNTWVCPQHKDVLELFALFDTDGGGER